MPDRISIDPNIRFGKPCVAGTRITVLEVLELVREGFGAEAIRNGFYPDLSDEDVRACVQYAMDLISLEDVVLAQPA